MFTKYDEGFINKPAFTLFAEKKEETVMKYLYNKVIQSTMRPYTEYEVQLITITS